MADFNLEDTIKNAALEQQTRTAQRQENLDRYQVRLTDDQYDFVSTLFKDIADPVEAENMSYRVANALKYSEIYGITPDEAYLNLEALNRENFGEDYKQPKSAFIATCDAFQQGLLQLQRNKICNQIWDAESRGYEDISELKNYLAEIDSQIAGLEDTQSRTWWQNCIKWGAQSAPFTGGAIASSALGMLLGGGVGAAVLGTTYSWDAMKGEIYQQLRDDGATVETAGAVANVSALLQGIVEESLGTVAGAAGHLFGKGAKTVSKSLVDKLTKGAYKNLYYAGGFKRIAALVSKTGLEYLGEAVEEGAEEVLQEIIDTFGRSIAYAIDEYGKDPNLSNEEREQLEALDKELGLPETMKRLGQSFIGGFGGALVLGIPNAGFNARANIKEFSSVKKAASTIDSKEAYMAQTAKSPIFEGMDAKTKAETQESIYDKFSAIREKNAEERRQAELDRAETIETSDLAEETQTDEEGKVVVKEAYRTENGRLNTEDRLIEDNDDGTSNHEFAIKGKDEELYGRIIYNVDGDNVTINDFTLTPGRENLRTEAFMDFAEKFAGKNIDWETRGESAAKVKQALIDLNATGSKNGLNYYTDKSEAKNQRARLSLADEMRQARPNATNEEIIGNIAAMESSLAFSHPDETLGDWYFNTAKGKVFTTEMTARQYQQAVKYFLDQNLSQEEAERKARDKIGGFFDQSQIEKAGRGFIYVAKNSDARTFMHEWMHFMRTQFTPEQNAEIGSLIGVKDSNNWSREDEERLVDHYMRYVAEGNTQKKELEPLFKKLNNALVRFYKSIVNAVEMSPEIRDFFDSLFKDPASALSQAERALNQLDRESEINKALMEDSTNEVERFIQDESNALSDRVEAAMDDAGTELLYMIIPELYADKIGQKEKLDTAKKMFTDGKSMKEIKRNTQWELDAQGNWVFESVDENETLINYEDIGMSIAANKESLRKISKSNAEAKLIKETTEEGIRILSYLNSRYPRLKNILSSEMMKKFNLSDLKLHWVDTPKAFRLLQAGDTFAINIRHFDGSDTLRRSLLGGMQYWIDTGHGYDLEDTRAQLEILQKSSDNIAAGDFSRIKTDFNPTDPDLYYHMMNQELVRRRINENRTQRVSKLLQEEYAEIEREWNKKATSDQLYFQIIGEEGAQNLDNAEEKTYRMDNLKVAIDMTSAGKDAKAIRLATGWEKGVDGKWRYEIEDFELKYPASEVKDGNTLKSLIYNKGLYGAYSKQLNSYKIRDISGRNEMGYANRIDKEIGLNLKKIKYAANPDNILKSTLLHEVQHVIQGIEDFATGGNLDTLSNMRFNSLVKDLAPIYAEIGSNEQLKEKVKAYKKALLEVDWSREDIVDQMEKAISIRDNDEKLSGLWDKLQDITKKYHLEYNEEASRLFDFTIYDTDSQNAKEAFRIVRDIFKSSAYTDYKSIAGEVESRNVQARMNLTPEERLYTLLRETEDIAREDQIVLYDGGEANNLLFQYMQEELDAQTLEEAAGFNTWQEWYEYAKVMDTDGVVTGAWDDVKEQKWFEAVWTYAKSIYEGAEEFGEPTTEPADNRTQEQLDKDFIGMLHEEGALQEFADKIRQYVAMADSLSSPMDEEEAAEFDRVIKEKSYINKTLQDPTWKSEELSPSQAKKLLSTIKDHTREYRAIYGEVYDDDTYKVPEGMRNSSEAPAGTAEEDLLNLDRMTPSQRAKAVEKLEDDRIRQQVKDGTLKMDGTIDRAIEVLSGDIDDLNKKITELQQEYDDALAEIKNEQKADLVREYAELQKQIETLERTAPSQINGTIKNAVEAGKAAQSNVSSGTNAGKIAEINKRMEYLHQILEGEKAATKAIEAAKAKGHYKTLYNKKLEDRRTEQEIRRARNAIVKGISRRVNFATVDYETGRRIIAVQNLLNDWLADGVNKWIGTDSPYLREVYSAYVTNEDARKEIQNKLNGRKRKYTAIAALNLLEGARNGTGKKFDEWTNTERKTVLKGLGSTDWYEKLSLSKKAKERQEQLPNQLDKNGKVTDETRKLAESILSPEIMARIEYQPMAEWNINQMEELGKLIDDAYVEGKKLLAGRQQLRRDEIEAIREQIKKTIRDTGIVINPDDPEDVKKKKQEKINKILGMRNAAKGTSAAAKEKNSFRDKFMAIDRGTGNVRRFARVMDNYSENVFTTTLCFREYAAYNEEQKRIKERTARIDNYLKEHNIDMDMLQERYNFPALMNGIDKSYSLDELLYIYVADMDEKSRDAVMYGNFGTAEEQEIAAKMDIDGLTGYKAQAYQRYSIVLNKAQEIINGNKDLLGLVNIIEKDYAEQYDRLNEASINMFNMPVNRVSAYVPLYRLEASGEALEQQVARDLMADTTGAPAQYVNRGMTKNRITISPLHQKPVQLGLMKTWADSMAKTEHFVAYGGLVRDLNAIYTGSAAAGTREVIASRYGDDANAYIKDYINELANPNKHQIKTTADKLAHILRGKTAPAYLSWKASGVIKQLCTSPWPFMAYVNPAEYLVAMGKFIAHPSRMSDLVKSKSAFMETRTIDPIIDLIKEAEDKADNKTKALFAQINSTGMQGLEWADWISVAPGWLAMYDHTVAELNKQNNGKTELDDDYIDPVKIEEIAIAKADDTVRLTQPSGRKADLAPLFKNSSEVVNLILQFQTALNCIYQQVRFDIPYQIHNKQYKQIVGSIIGYTLAGILVNAVVSGPGDDDDDTADKVKRGVYYATTQFTDAVPMVGSQLTGLTEKLLTGKGQFFSTNLFPVLDSLKKTVVDVSNDNWTKACEDFAQGVGYSLGLPVSGSKEVKSLLGIDEPGDKIELHPEALWGRRK